MEWIHNTAQPIITQNLIALPHLKITLIFEVMHIITTSETMRTSRQIRYGLTWGGGGGGGGAHSSHTVGAKLSNNTPKVIADTPCQMYSNRNYLLFQYYNDTYDDT